VAACRNGICMVICNSGYHACDDSCIPSSRLCP
jgi:hypothetical protein